MLGILSIFAACFASATANCNAYSPAFPLPELDPNSRVIQKARDDIVSILTEAIGQPGYNKTHFSVAVTSKKQTLFELHHTARDRDENRPGAKNIDGNSRYRIASCTKAFTVLALLQQQKAGKLSLDDPINLYIDQLNAPQNGSLPWKDITLRALASQLSGIPRDYGQSDMLTVLDDPVAHGLPPLSPSEHLEAQCDSNTNYTKPCTQADLLHRVLNAEPIFPPKQQSTYSNINYELIALALENITSTPYVDLIQSSILDPFSLTSTSFNKPPDSVAALPKDTFFYWDVEMGMQNSAGGLYSTSDDLSKFLRYVLTSYNGLTPALNWIAPVSFSTGMNTFYGSPWEIFRTPDILPYTSRPVTFVTKGGGLPGYFSQIVSVPDYDFAFTVLVAGNPNFLGTAVETIGVRMVRAADETAQANLRTKYTGTWKASSSSNINSTITLSHSKARGLYIKNWISNGTEMLGQASSVVYTSLTPGVSNPYLQLVPTLLFKDEKNQRGEVWRMLGQEIEDSDVETSQKIFKAGSRGHDGLLSDFCVTDVDVGAYGGRPVNELSFWDETEDGTGFGTVELTGFRIRLERDE